MSFLNEFLFGVFPYIAGTVFLIGSLARYDRDQFTWKTSSSQMLRSKGFGIANRLFHVGVIFLFFGHLVGLLMPHSWYPYLGLTPASKQLMAMVAGGIFGTLALIGSTMLLWRRVTDERVRATSSRADTFILLVLYAQLLLGMLTIYFSAGHMDGSLMISLSNWAQALVTFKANPSMYLVDVPMLYKAHLFLGCLIFLIFPFTRMVHVWSVPFHYVGRRYQLVRSRG